MSQVEAASREVLSSKPDLRKTRAAKSRARSESFKLTASQREILRQLHEYRILTPRLLTLVYGAKDGREGRGYWHLLRQLRILHDADLVRRLHATRVKSGGGSDEFVYRLTGKGATAVLPTEECARERRRLRIEARSDRAQVDHSLAVSTLQLILSLGQDGWRLMEFGRDERGQLGRGLGTVCPDATALIETVGRDGLPESLRLIFEVDLARKSNERVRNRFAEYGRLLAGQDVPTIVVMLAPSEAELERLLKLAPSVAMRDMPFLFWNLSDWYEADETGSRRLRHPRAILAETSLATMQGEARRLVDWQHVQEGSSRTVTR